MITGRTIRIAFGTDETEAQLLDAASMSFSRPIVHNRNFILTLNWNQNQHAAIEKARRVPCSFGITLPPLRKKNVPRRAAFRGRIRKIGKIRYESSEIDVTTYASTKKEFALGIPIPSAYDVTIYVINDLFWY